MMLIPIDKRKFSFSNFNLKMSESISFSSSSSSFSFQTKSTEKLKLLFIGDHAVGKSNLIERFRLLHKSDSHFNTSQSTKIELEFFESNLRRSENFSNSIHACLLILDGTRPSTFGHFDRFYKDLRDIYRHVPFVCVVNKIDVANRSLAFSTRHHLPLYFVSAVEGTNVNRLFRHSIELADAYRTRSSSDFLDEFLQEFDNQRNDGDFRSETVDSLSHQYENHQTDRSDSPDRSYRRLFDSSCCIGKHRRLTECFLKLRNEREEKKTKFWLNLLLAEEWNYFYLLKDKSQPFDEQERHIKRLHNASKFSSILEIYLNSFVPQKLPSMFNRTIYLNHYERLQCLFNSLIDVIRTKNEVKLCSTILERINYLLNKMKEFRNEEIFLQFPSFIPRMLILSSNDQNQTLEILSKDKQTLIERVPLYLIVGLNLQDQQHLLVLSVEQPRGSNSVNNYQFAHADQSVIHQWYQLLDKHIKKAKSDYMNKYQEYRI